MFSTLWKVHRLCNFFQNYSEACSFFTSCGQSEKIFRGSSASFVTAFKIILKLVDFFTSCRLLEKIFRTLRKFCKLCNFIQNHSKACRFFTSCGQSEKILTSLRKVCKLCKFIWNNPELCRIFQKFWAVKKNI